MPLTGVSSRNSKNNGNITEKVLNFTHISGDTNYVYYSNNFVCSFTYIRGGFHTT